MTAFEEMGVLPEIAKAVEQMEWNLPTDIQAEGIPAILGGGDVLMAAETGSGKTGAFCLPIVQLVHEWLRDVASGKRGRARQQVEVSNRWEINQYDRDDEIVIEEDGLTCSSSVDNWRGARANRAVHSRGRYFYEVTVIDGLCRVGWSAFDAKLDLGTDPAGFGFGGTGKKSNSRQFTDYGDSFGANDVIGCYLDRDSNLIKFSKNGHDLGRAFDVRNFERPLAPAFCLKHAQLVFNFGESPFRYAPPNDWTALCRASEANIAVYKPVSASAESSSRLKNAPQALILEPSRELAEQTANEIRKFKKYLTSPAITEVLLLGGVGVREQVDALERGTNIVIGTIGRVSDLVQGGTLPLGGMRFFVLDECDALLAQGNADQIARLHASMPKVATDGKRVQTIVCSATLHNFEVKKLADRIMCFPTWIDLKGEDTVPLTVHHCVVPVDPKTDTRWRDGNKFLAVNQRIRTDAVHAADRLSPGDLDRSAETASEAVKILKGEYVLTAIREHKMERALIFCRTKVDCDNLQEYFTRLGGGPRAKSDAELSCTCLHGDILPADRKSNLEDFKEKRVRFLICTDVAARGIDIKGLPYVINMTLPDDKAQYLHRIGRVGRAERMGLAISLVASHKEKVWYHSCPSRGKQCNDTRLAQDGGCTIWYNERQIQAEIEDSLNITIPQIATDMRVPVSELDGKVVYGQRSQQAAASAYRDHFSELGPARQQLLMLEKTVQSDLLDLKFKRSYSDRTRDGMNNR